MKKAIQRQLLELIEERIISAADTVMTAKESRDNDDKSTSGDKHETSRAMMEIELEKAMIQESRIRQMKTDLLRIDLDHEHKKIGVGSLVKTSNGLYFMGIAWGTIRLDDVPVYCISLASPIGMLLKGLQAGDTIHFMEKDIVIEKVS